MPVLTLSEVRDEGFSDPPYSDARITRAIAMVDNYIETTTGNFFDPRTQVFFLDGSGTSALMMPYPIISITEIIEDDSQPLDLTSIKVYNRHLSGLRNQDQDDRHNPKIEFSSDEFPRYQANRSALRLFTEGRQNWKVTGVFGYRDYDPLDLVNGQIPPMVQQAALMLLRRFLEPAAGGKFQEAWGGYQVKKTKTRSNECELGGAIVAGKLHGGISGDWHIDQLLSMFCRPAGGMVI